MFVKFGFPLNIDPHANFKSEKINHPSATRYPDHIDHYIAKEKAQGALLGPFTDPPFHMHISPSMSREKSDSDKHRVIVDLSWSKGSAINDAVNPDTYVGVDFVLTLPTVDHITKAVKNLVELVIWPK